jgi:DNA-binding MarR family transcriptional regulator
LERRGLVKITPDPEDRRSRLLILTPKGTRLLFSAVPTWESTHRELEALLGGEEPARLRKNLQALL